MRIRIAYILIMAIYTLGLTNSARASALVGEFVIQVSHSHDHSHSDDHHHHHEAEDTKQDNQKSPSESNSTQHSHDLSLNAPLFYNFERSTLPVTLSLPSQEVPRGNVSQAPKEPHLGSIFRPPIA